MSGGDVVLTDDAVGVCVILRYSCPPPNEKLLMAHIHIKDGLPGWKEFYRMRAGDLALGNIATSTWGIGDPTSVRRMFRAVALTATWGEKARLRGLLETYT